MIKSFSIFSIFSFSFFFVKYSRANRSGSISFSFFPNISGAAKSSKNRSYTSVSRSSLLLFFHPLSGSQLLSSRENAMNYTHTVHTQFVLILFSMQLCLLCRLLVFRCTECDLVCVCLIWWVLSCVLTIVYHCVPSCTIVVPKCTNFNVKEFWPLNMRLTLPGKQFYQLLFPVFCSPFARSIPPNTLDLLFYSFISTVILYHFIIS